MKYINTKTKAIIETNSKVCGENWVLLEEYNKSSNGSELSKPKTAKTAKKAKPKINVVDESDDIEEETEDDEVEEE